MGLFPVSEQKERELLEKMEQLEIMECDLREQFIRGSGSGGQKINKTSVCVLLMHEPSGIEVRCQESRSQAMNRFYARRRLCDLLEAKILGENSKIEMEREKIRRQKRRRSRKAKEKILSDKLATSKRKQLRRVITE